MNIFVLSLQVLECAMYYCDQHVVKMILESAELLCNACILSGGKAGYEVVLENHQCTKWVMSSLSNWKWLRELAEALNNEFKYRYKKNIDHKSIAIIRELEEPKIEDKGLLPFAQAMPDQYKNPDAITAYRNYYAGEKYKFATWKNRDIPDWYIELRKNLGGDAIKEVKDLLDPVNRKLKRLEAKEKKQQKLERKKKRQEAKEQKLKNLEEKKKNKMKIIDDVISKNNEPNKKSILNVQTRKSKAELKKLVEIPEESSMKRKNPSSVLVKKLKK